MNQTQTNGHSGNGNGHTGNGTEVFGASQVGVFEFVPRVGYREYWYPGIESKLVKEKPRALKVLGDDIVFFRDAQGKVAALADYCPHRGARLSGGYRRTSGGGPEPGRHNNEFKGYLTCPYHGFTFDGTGECVAALTEGPDSGLVSKLRAQNYPTVELKGIVFVWMGKTAPVPIEEDIPDYFFEDDVMVETYIRRWDLNWSLTVENSHDSHAVKIHRGSLRRVWTRSIFRKSAGYHGRMRIAKEGENYIHITAAADAHAPSQAFYPRIGKQWPQRTWFMLKGNARTQRDGARKQFDKNRPGYTGLYQLPAWVSPNGSGDRCHLRMAVPVNGDITRMWTFTLTRKSFWPGWKQAMWKLDYHLRHVYMLPQGTNEHEDMPVQSVGCLDPDRPQKLGATDAGLIFWRRRMPFKSRDAQLVSQQTRDDAMREIERLEVQEAIETPV